MPKLSNTFKLLLLRNNCNWACHQHAVGLRRQDKLRGYLDLPNSSSNASDAALVPLETLWHYVCHRHCYVRHEIACCKAGGTCRVLKGFCCHYSSGTCQVPWHNSRARSVKTQLSQENCINCDCYRYRFRWNALDQVEACITLQARTQTFAAATAADSYEEAFASLCKPCKRCPGT